MKSSFLEQLQTDPDAAARRLIRRAHNRDGLPEISIGLVLLTASSLIGLEISSPRESFGYRASAWGMMLVVAPMIGVAPWAIQWLRRRFLMERVGFVELKPLPKKLLTTVACVAFVVAAAMAWAVSMRILPPDGWLLAGTGIAWGLLAAYAGRLPRYVIGGTLMAVLATGLAFSGVSYQWGSLILYGSMGLLSLISGCVVLLHFIRMRSEEVA